MPLLSDVAHRTPRTIAATAATAATTWTIRPISGRVGVGAAAGAGALSSSAVMSSSERLLGTALAGRRVSRPRNLGRGAQRYLGGVDQLRRVRGGRARAGPVGVPVLLVRCRRGRSGGVRPRHILRAADVDPVVGGFGALGVRVHGHLGDLVAAALVGAFVTPRAYRRIEDVEHQTQVGGAVAGHGGEHAGDQSGIGDEHLTQPRLPWLGDPRDGQQVRDDLTELAAALVEQRAELLRRRGRVLDHPAQVAVGLLQLRREQREVAS